jgi:SAM-dependent methyltransferase
MGRKLPLGWFRIAGVQDGPRTLEEQLTGLELVREACAERVSVLDLGCAEGLIAADMIACGAYWVDALDCNVELLKVAKQLHAPMIDAMSLQLHQVDLNHLEAYYERGCLHRASYDVVLMLSIVHKLTHPIEFLEYALSFASDWLAVRLPSPVINHRKSESKDYDIRPTLARNFDAVAEPPGPRGEWTGIYRRR